jgi:hypothetical protein
VGHLTAFRTLYIEGDIAAERSRLAASGISRFRLVGRLASDGFSGTGVGFYHTNLLLYTPDGHDVSLSLGLSFDGDDTSENFRAYIYLRQRLLIWGIFPGA